MSPVLGVLSRKTNYSLLSKGSSELVRKIIFKCPSVATYAPWGTCFYSLANKITLEGPVSFKVYKEVVSYQTDFQKLAIIAHTA